MVYSILPHNNLFIPIIVILVYAKKYGESFLFLFLFLITKVVSTIKFNLSQKKKKTIKFNYYFSFIEIWLSHLIFIESPIHLKKKNVVDKHN